jgi:hypothetical protein
MSKRSVFLFITIGICISVYSQENKKPKDLFLEAEYFFMKGAYPDALSYYLQLNNKLPENANISYCIGVCYLNMPGQKKLAISYLEKATGNMSAKHKEGTIKQVSAPYDALYRLGTAYRINNMFDKAKDTFTKYAATLSPDDSENTSFINQEIKACDRAVELLAKPIAYTEQNIGEPFNNEKSNFSPVISADGKSFLYKETLKFYDAIMFTRMQDGKWTPPVNILPEIQTDAEIYISSLSADGKLLLFSKNDNFNSDIFSSSFDGSKWSKPVILNNNINSKYWESHGFLSEDGNQLLFASDRPGGSGGLDLYISVKTNGDWGPAINMGSQLNTPFNEDLPFIVNNGKTIFFSSQGHDNIGGYDIFKADIQSDGTWSKPKNLGYPINTTDDDTFFMPVGDGKSGYYSSFKTSGGFGKLDIYKITFK